MVLGIENGWLQSALQCPSPNCNERPEGVEPSLLVIHCISLPPGVFVGREIREFFCNQLDCDQHPYFDQIRNLEVSAHLLIERDGTTVQFVSLDQRAWHAGVSCWKGRDNCNDFSIGIELEGTDTGAYTDAQYQRLADVTALLRQHYPAISTDRVVGHSDIAPGRKTDPGPGFDWARYRHCLQETF